MVNPYQAQQPSQEQIQAYIRQVAQKYGIDADTFLQVVKGESGFNPAAVGDSGHSLGIAQLYDKGLAPEFQQKTGLNPGDPSSWMQAIDFMAQKVSQGGWTPWHAARNQGISQFAGLGGQQATAAGRQGLAGLPYTPGAPTALASNQFGGLDMNQWRDMWDPKGDHTLGGAAVSGLVKLFGGPDRSQLRQSEKSSTIPSLLYNALTGGKEFAPQTPNQMVEAKYTDTSKLNPASPIPLAKQATAAAQPTLGRTLANYISGTQPKAMAATARKPTLGSSLFGTQQPQQTVAGGILGMFKPGGFFGF